MEHRFYLKSEDEQRIFLLKVMSAVFLSIAAILWLAIVTELYFLVLLISLVLLIAAPFIDTPSGKKKGTLIYFSPLFITQKRGDQIILHGGTLFDYLHTIKPDMNAEERTRFVLSGYLMGMNKFISAYENEPENITVRGTSYIINERTARRIGLQPVQTDFLQWIILILNYIPLTLSYSYIKGRLRFPRISNIKTYEGSMEDLISRKESLIKLEKRIAVVE